ncbi:hypothetical protein [Aestuariibaculum sediminum]|uniref:Uncharacterized protein n=1 Tax=Aestuariibaculum sediminum TaxID=2770637 RepID=A0A8J6UFA0_9FLAO|nr:hypothetical protein [Aestuariibaculum sediminum]MBD0831301.1 hypothetical protein [Aestuariibaculum sediminum]
MEIINQHINTLLKKNIQKKEVKNNLFSSLSNYKLKKRFKNVLAYFDLILDYHIQDKSNDINSIHIHFELDFSDELEALLFEFIILKLYFNSNLNDLNKQNKEYKNHLLKDKVEELQRKNKILNARCPEGASAKNGGNKIYKKWVLKKSESNCLYTFFDSLDLSSSFSIKSLINCKVREKQEIIKIFKLTPYAVDIDSNQIDLAYNCFNTDYTLNEIDTQNSRLVDNIKNIILFDCESKKIMSSFSLQEIEKWNEEYGTNFNRYAIITFGKGHKSFNSIRNKIEMIKERFKIPQNATYTILGSEIDFLLRKKEKTSIPVDFLGFDSCSFWDAFLLETGIRDLYELRSLKMMNIYSLCLNEDIKCFLLEDLFSLNESSELITLTTKQLILELREEDIETLKDILSNVLDFIIKINLTSKITEFLNNDISTIIVDDSVVKCPKLISKLIKTINLPSNFKFKLWSELSNSNSEAALILSYRDQGKYPNNFHPNLLEITKEKDENFKALLISFLFKHQYSWSRYNLYNDYHKYLDHNIRQNSFGWDKLKNLIRNEKPSLNPNIDWNLENEYSSSDQREFYKIKSKGKSSKTFYGSDLFIISDESNTTFRVERVDYLSELEFDDRKMFIQNLDEIQEDINIYEKITDTKQQDEELSVIRERFDIGHESVGRLWKILLKQKSDDRGESKLYSELKTYLETKNLRIVSYSYFKKNWINPQSDSIAPLSKRVFIELCEYLDIPKIYFIIIQRIRNSSKLSSRKSTKQMNQLLKDLFNDCCFDENINVRSIISQKLFYYKTNHPIDELGIDENYLVDNLVVLTELIQPELKLIELETIEKIEA